MHAKTALVAGAVSATALMLCIAPRMLQAQPAPLQEPDALPVCNNGGPYLFECTGPSTSVTLDGSASYDPDGTPLTFFWLEECPFATIPDPTSVTPTLIMDMTDVCIRPCTVELKVTSGGQFQKCVTTVTVQDTTPPVMSCPPDVIEIWTVGPAGGQTDPNLTGFATASDCDPNVVITYSDVLTPGTQPGDPETIVTRTWVGLDQCGLQNSCVQTITLLSPSSASQTYYSDDLPGICPNDLSVGSTGVYVIHLFGLAAYPVSNINQSTLVISRLDNVGNQVKRMSIKVQDVGRPTLGNPCACDGLNDGKLDLKISASMTQLIAEFQLAAELPGTNVPIAVFGKTNDNKWFVSWDCVIVQP
jgi:hypothetical protein